MNNETGEFELVLGNRQLLSGFFIVVILFGVFFTMGYIVGRNSAPSARTAAGIEQAAGGETARPQSASGTPPQAQSPGGSQPADLSGEAEDAPPHPSTRPVQDADATEMAAAAAPLRVPETAAPARTGIIEPAAGDVYLQVMAVRRPEAEVVVKTLRDKGFRAALGQGPNDLLRVLVGPFGDTASLGQAKAGLENAGFHPIVRK